MSNRGHLRISAALKVVVQTPGELEPEPYMTKDLGLGGIFVLAKTGWPIGSEMLLKIVHGLLEVEVRGRVVRHEAAGVGFAFVDPSPAAQSVIEEIIVDLVAVGADLDERRGEPRHRTEITVTWRYDGVDQTSRLLNLSFKGAFIRISNPPPAVGTICFLYLPALVGEGQPALEVRGCEVRVMHIAVDGFGVQFQRPSDEFRSAISSLVRWLAAENKSD